MRIVTSKSKVVSERVEDDYLLGQFQDEMIEDKVLSFPTLYIVNRRNPYLRQGAFVRWFEDGYEECVVDSPNGKLELLGYRGPVFPHSTLAPFLLAVQNSGLDAGAARQDRRRMMRQEGAE